MYTCTFYISFQKNAVLHIVNGDCAIEALKDSGIEGDFLSWLDVLHDGPVPEGLSLEELPEVSADFIADCDWEVLEKAKNAFQKRDIFPQMSRIRRSGSLEQL